MYVQGGSVQPVTRRRFNTLLGGVVLAGCSFDTLTSFSDGDAHAGLLARSNVGSTDFLENNEEWGLKFRRIASISTRQSLAYGNLWLERAGEQICLNIFTQVGRSQAAYFLRDVQQNRIGQPDMRLLMGMSWMQWWLAIQGFYNPVHVLSGLRMPATNKMTEGAAKESLHIPDQFGRFRAVDFRMQQIPSKYLAELARRLKVGGVGYYQREFIHLDTGSIRHWQAE